MSTIRVLYIMANAKRGGAENLTTIMMLNATEPFKSFAYLLDNGPLVEELRHAGIQVTSFTETFGFKPRLRNPIHFIKVIRHILSTIKLQRVQLVHSVMSYGHLFGGIASLFSKLPNVWYEHGPVSRWNRLAQLIPTNVLFANSNYTLAQCKKNFIVAKQTQVVIPAVPQIEKNEALQYRTLTRKSLHLLPECTVIGIVGRLSPEKGVDIFLEATHTFLGTHPQFNTNNLRFMLIGGEFKETDRSYKKVLDDVLDRSMIGRNETIRPYVIETGYVYPAWKSMAACDIIANTSRVPEGFGLTLIEGLSLGCKVIAPNQGAPPEFLKEDDSTTFFESGDVNSLTNAFEKSLFKLNKKSEPKINLRSISDMIGELESSYRAILSKSVQSNELRILATAYDYKPSFGGVASCAYQTLHALNKVPGVSVRLIAKDHIEGHAFDLKSGIETIRINLPKQTLLAAPLLSYHIIKQTAAFKPHFILNFLWLPEGLASYAANLYLRIKKIPYGVFAHGVEIMESNRNFRKKLRAKLSFLKRAVFQNASFVFPVSQFTKELVVANCKVNEDRVRIIHNGIDPRDFYPEPPNPELVSKYRIEGKSVFLTVSRLNDYKGMDHVLSAMRTVIKKHPNTVYLISGTGRDRERLETIAKDYKILEHVRFTGPVAPNQLRDHFNLCDCFVLMTRTDPLTPNCEGFGIVFLEAAACAKPSIGGKDGGIPDAIENEKSGWLVNPIDDEAIAMKMIEVLENKESAKNIGKQARARALEHFTWNDTATSLLKEIKTSIDLT